MVPLLPVLRCGVTSCTIACSAEEQFGFKFTGGELDADAFEFYLSGVCEVRSVLEELTADITRVHTHNTSAHAHPDGGEEPVQKDDWLAAQLRRTSSGVGAAGVRTTERISLLSRVLSRRVERSGDWLQRRVHPGYYDAEVPVVVQASLQGLSKVSPVLVSVSRACVGALVATASELGRRTSALARSRIGERTADPDALDEEQEQEEQREAEGNCQPAGVHGNCKCDHDESEVAEEGAKAGRFSGERWTAARDLAGESASSLVAVWNSLFVAGEQLAETVTDSTAEVVGHRYGEAASNACRDGLTIGVDLVKTTYFARQLGMESAALLVARESGRAALLGETHAPAQHDEKETSAPDEQPSAPQRHYEIPGSVPAGAPIVFHA
jgi:Senescence domain